MRILGREPSALLRVLARIPLLSSELSLFRSLFVDPWGILTSYVFRRPYPGKVVRLKRGGEIHIANQTEDIVTIVVVMVRDDYGPIVPGSVVLDIGANVGVFAMKAAREGAASVYCIEPNPTTLAALRATVDSLPRSSGVTIDDRAIWTRDGETLFMPAASSPAASASVASHGPSQIAVRTVALSTVFAALPEQVDVVKMDCEGAEYPVILNSEPEIWNRVRELRMEYHNGRVDELLRHLALGGLHLVKHTPAKVDGQETGTLLLRRRK
jgi:FkbM family methyltransferase